MVAPAGFDVGATIGYNCDDGHLLVGPANRSCMDTGFYNEFPPVCKCKFYFSCNFLRFSPFPDVEICLLFFKNVLKIF